MVSDILFLFLAFISILVGFSLNRNWENVGFGIWELTFCEVLLLLFLVLVVLFERKFSKNELLKFSWLQAVVFNLTLILTPFIFEEFNQAFRGSTLQAGQTGEAWYVYGVALILVLIFYVINFVNIYKEMGIKIMMFNILEILLFVIFITLLFFYGHPHHAFIGMLLALTILNPFNVLANFVLAIAFGVTVHGLAKWGAADAFELF